MSSASASVGVGAGLHHFPFVFNAPATVPSSFESPSGHVRYWCKAYLQRPWKFDVTTKKPFSVISIVDLSREPAAFVSASIHVRIHDSRSHPPVQQISP